MKCISFILIILCLCYQTKQQVVASTANIYALQTNTISTPNKYVSIAKAQQQGGYLGYDEEAEIARDREWYKQQQELEAAKVTSDKSSKQGGSIGFDREAANAEILKAIKERDAKRQADKVEQSVASGKSPQQGGSIGYGEEFNTNALKFIKEREAKRQADSQTNPLRVAILTYGTIGIVVLFIIITVVTFCILYTRRNKDNPKHNKS